MSAAWIVLKAKADFRGRRDFITMSMLSRPPGPYLMGLKISLAVKETL